MIIDDMSPSFGCFVKSRMDFSTPPCCTIRDAFAVLFVASNFRVVSAAFVVSASIFDDSNIEKIVGIHFSSSPMTDRAFSLIARLVRTGGTYRLH